MVNTVFEFREAIVSYEASSVAGQVEIYTDMPSPWAVRSTVALPVTTSGKATVPKTLDVEGTAFKVKFTAGASTGVLKPYAMVLKVRRIGLYLSAGETWETNEITVNV